MGSIGWNRDNGKIPFNQKWWQLKVNFALIIMKYTVHLPFYLTQLSLLLRAVNKLCLQLSVKDSVVSNIMVGELYISLYLEQNSPLGAGAVLLCSCVSFSFVELG